MGCQLAPVTAGIGVWLDGVGQAEMYGTGETNEWTIETSQMPGGHSSQQRYKDRRSTCKDRFERTRQIVSPSTEPVGLEERRKGEV